MTFVQHSVLSWRHLLPLIVGVFVTVESALGCTGVGERSLPTEFERKLQSTAAAEDHLLAALAYQKQAQLVETAALKYEETARKITPLEDPKGFRRSGFTSAGKECRKEAVELQRLADHHRQKAETLQASHQAK